MKIKKIRDKEQKNIYMKMRYFPEEKTMFLDIWEADELYDKIISPTIELGIRQIKILKEFLEKILETWERGSKWKKKQKN